jgi:tetratricopeptide (TPR) repeat protein
VKPSDGEILVEPLGKNIHTAHYKMKSLSAISLTILAIHLFQCGVLQSTAVRAEAPPADSWPIFSTPDSIKIAEIDSLLEHGAYREALSAVRILAGEVEATYGKESLELTRVLDLLVEALARLSRYTDDEISDVASRSLAIKKSKLGLHHRSSLRSLCDLAFIAHGRNRSIEAEALFENLIAWGEEHLGPNDPDMAEYLHAEAVLFIRLGRYSEAIPLVERSLAILQQDFAVDYPEVGDKLNELGLIYNYTGQYEKAEAAYQKALEIYRSHYGEQHPETGAVWHNLALLMDNMKQYSEADSLYNLALSIWLETLGEDHPWVASCRHNLAYVYYAMRDYAKSESMFRAVLEFRQEELLADDPDIAATVEGLAWAVIDQGRLAEADSLFRVSLGIRERSLGSNHHLTAVSQKLLSMVLRARGQVDSALSLAVPAHVTYYNYLQANIAALSETNAIKYAGRLREFSDNIITCYLLHTSPPPESLSRLVAEAAIRSKGQVLKNLLLRQKMLARLADSTVAAKRDSLQIAKSQLSQVVLQDIEGNNLESRVEWDSLRHRIEELEMALAGPGPTPGEPQESQELSIESLQENLAGIGCLVEYTCFSLMGPWRTGSTPHMMATVLQPEGEPILIDLGPLRPIDSLVALYRSNLEDAATSGNFARERIRSEYEAIARALYHRVWRPIEEHIGHRQLILISPDASLCLVAFAGLMDDEGTYLVEKQALHCVSAGGDVLRLREEAHRNRGLLAIADPDFDAPAQDRVSSSADLAQDSTTGDNYAVRNIRAACDDLSDI